MAKDLRVFTQPSRIFKGDGQQEHSSSKRFTQPHRYEFQTEISQCVATIDYDAEENVLTIAFVNRGTYVYHDFPLDLFLDFQGSGSRGKFFNDNIRNASFQYERVA